MFPPFDITLNYKLGHLAFKKFMYVIFKID